MNSKLTAMLMTFSFAVSFNALAVPLSDENSELTETNLTVQNELAIKSVAELDKHLELSSAQKSPLGKLSDAGLNRFVSSLTFNDKGISGFSYAELEGMNAADVHRILKLFGVQRTMPLIKNVRVSTKLDAQAKSVKLPSQAQSGTVGDLINTGGWGSGYEDLNQGDRDGYYCAGAGSCGPRILWICTANC